MAEKVIISLLKKCTKELEEAPLQLQYIKGTPQYQNIFRIA